MTRRTTTTKIRTAIQSNDNKQLQKIKTTTTKISTTQRQPQQNKPLFGIPGNTSNDQKSMYKEYGWLFGKVK